MHTAFHLQPRIRRVIFNLGPGVENQHEVVLLSRISLSCQGLVCYVALPGEH